MFHETCKNKTIHSYYLQFLIIDYCICSEINKHREHIKLNNKFKSVRKRIILHLLEELCVNVIQ